RWLRLNRRYLELLGYEENELRSFRHRDVIHPMDAPAADEATQRLDASNAATEHLLQRYVRRDGHIVWVELVMAAAPRDWGSPAHIIVTASDVTERRRIERELAEAAEVRERFIGVLGHDLRNPLNAITVTAQHLFL